jgi:starch phosphorylase
MPLKPSGSQSEGAYVYEASGVPCRVSGLRGYTLRVLPHHPDLATPFQPGLIVWAQMA